MYLFWIIFLVQGEKRRGGALLIAAKTVTAIYDSEF